MRAVLFQSLHMTGWRWLLLYFIRLRVCLELSDQHVLGFSFQLSKRKENTAVPP